MNFLDEILPVVKKTISSEYYEKEKKTGKKKKSLSEAIREAKKTPVIAEVKPRSPSKGELIGERNAEKIIQAYAKEGACAVSILTEPVKFKGDLKLLEKEYGVPLLQKDFIIDERQMSANADAVLLIMKFCELAGVDVNELVEKAHARGLEVLLETHSLEEFEKAMKTKADVVGINNRNLETLETDIRATIGILKQAGKRKKKVVVSESGFSSREQIELVLKAGADAVLVGTSLMQSKKPEEKLNSLIGANSYPF